MATKREVLACLEQSQLQRDFRRPATARAVPGLAPELHAYQAAALEWMLQREQRRDSLPAAEALLGGTISDVRGGVLADEMGLGKTVTVAALVLAAPEEDDATQQAETTRVALRLGGARLPATTLMEKPLPDPPKGERRGGVRVCVRLRRRRLRRRGLRLLRRRRPQSLRGRRELRLPRFKGSSIGKRPRAVARDFSGMSRGHRGAVERELARHAPSLKWRSTRACKLCKRPRARARARSNAPRTRNYGRALQSLGDCLRRLDGSMLRQADVVLTTFGALRSDRYYQPQQAYAARVPPSPLLTTDWRRVCLDEAQVVRGGATAAATVARKLSADRRWCVSGTPIAAGGLEDVRALYEFLGSPSGYSSRQWSEAVGSEGGATKLADLFKATAWRATSKIEWTTRSRPKGRSCGT